MPNKTKKEIEKELQEVKQELVSRSHEANAMAAGASGLGMPKMVPIRNYGGTLVFIDYEVNGVPRKIVLESSGRRSMGAIPLDTWLDLEENDLVKMGYIARTDEPITNPNVIDDLEKFFLQSSEAAVKNRMKEVTNPNVLWRCLGYLESLPDERKDGKVYSAIQAVTGRIKDLTGAVVSTEDVA
jgi:hypothetical protein